jgi:rhodanese-related sulfurtransferase
VSVKRVTPQEAQRLVDQEGYVYVDVRSIPEFEAGHPAGAFNVPIAHLGAMGMTANADFLDVMTKRFGPGSRLVVGCQSGGRSLHAAMALQAAGFADVVDQRAGFGGTRAEPGWHAAGLPSETGAGADRSYEELKK